MPTLKVTAVTPVHDRKDITLNCLRSLFGSDLTGIDLRVVIVDDGSTDGTADAIRSDFPDVEIVPGSGELWYTAGMNAGISKALEGDPDFILAFNNDCKFKSDFLIRLIETAEKFPHSVVGAVLVNWDDRESVFQVAPKWSVWWGGMRHWQKQTIRTLPSQPWKVELIVGNCVLFPTAAISENGLMDAKRLPQYGDAEYTPRMRKAGWDLIMDPRALVYCKPNDVPESVLRLPLTAMVGKMLFDPFHPHSLKRRLNMSLGSAPNRLEGYAAFVVFFLRYLIGRNIEGEWAFTQEEPPLSEIYKNALMG